MSTTQQVLVVMAMLVVGGMMLGMGLLGLVMLHARPLHPTRLKAYGRRSLEKRRRR